MYWIHYSTRTVDVAAGRKKNRIAVAPPTAAELAAAMQRASDNEAGSSTQQRQPAPGTQGSQGRPTEKQGSSGNAGEIVYEGYGVWAKNHAWNAMTFEGSWQESAVLLMRS
ncbi:hypothetical protein EDB19DRAFT_1828262 [Suillus lakei]|nr:hypothetical protein EDB19DRAFT_1828262 [Suillus lakei]